MTDRPVPPLRDLGLFALVAAPFFLNDFLFIAGETAGEWLAADYGSKVLAHPMTNIRGAELDRESPSDISVEI